MTVLFRVVFRTVAIILMFAIAARIMWASGFPEVWVWLLLGDENLGDTIETFRLWDIWPWLDTGRWLGLRELWSDLLKFFVGSVIFSGGIGLFKEWVGMAKEDE